MKVLAKQTEPKAPKPAFPEITTTMKSIVCTATLAACFAQCAAAALIGFQGSTYEIISTNLTWTESQSLAASKSVNAVQGYLAAIGSQAENDFLAAQLTDGNGNAWIGFNQSPGGTEPAGGWGWVNGEAVSYTNWDPFNSEPNEFLPDEDYAILLGNGFDVVSRRGTWIDLQNDHSTVQFAVIEYDTAIPEPHCASLIGAALIAGVFVRRSRKQPANAGLS